MKSKLAVAVLAGALLMSGLQVGVSYGGRKGITEPTVLKLHWNTRLEDSRVESFIFGHDGKPCDETVPVCGQITLKDMSLFDKDGNEVGRQHISCTVSDRTEWFCSFVSEIEDGPYTEEGTVTGLGVKRPNGNSLVSITGGTGAYENVGGHAWKDGDNSRVGFTLHLLP